MLPSGRYSNTVSSILKEIIVAREAVIARIEYYNNSDEDIARAVKLVSDTVDNLNEIDLNIKKPVVIIADDAEALGKVYAQIYQYNLDKNAVIAGDSRINIKTNQNMDIIYTSSLISDYDKISKRAQRLGINHLDFMHELAYDAGKLTAELIATQYNKNEFAKKILAVNFVGMSGKIHFRDSIATRNYEALSRSNGRIASLQSTSIKNQEMVPVQGLAKSDDNISKNISDQIQNTPLLDSEPVELPQNQTKNLEQNPNDIAVKTNAEEILGE